jgi:hypothetical protein
MDMYSSTILHSGVLTTAMLLAVVGTVAGTPLFSRNLTVCVEVYTALPVGAITVFEEELKSIASISGLSLQILHQPEECGDVRLQVKSMPPTESSALGAARVRDGRVLPTIEIYATSISALMRSTLPALVGRGMARVAAHEIGHYVLQSTSHSKGLMTEYYTAAHLLVKDNRPFRIPLVAQNREPRPIRFD